jgi:hypothetical protein
MSCEGWLGTLPSLPLGPPDPKRPATTYAGSTVHTAVMSSMAAAAVGGITSTMR